MPFRRTGRRYLSFWVAGERDHNIDDVAMAVQKGVLSLYGTKGLSRLDPKLVEFKENEQKGIIRCTRENLTEMRVALTFITLIGDSYSAIYVEKVSGTLRSLRIT